MKSLQSLTVGDFSLFHFFYALAVQGLFYVTFRCSLFSTHLQCRGCYMLLFVCANSNQKRTGGCRPYGYPALSRLPHSKLHALQLRQTRRRINRRIWWFVESIGLHLKFFALLIFAQNTLRSSPYLRHHKTMLSVSNETTFRLVKRTMSNVVTFRFAHVPRLF